MEISVANFKILNNRNRLIRKIGMFTLIFVLWLISNKIDRYLDIIEASKKVEAGKLYNQIDRKLKGIILNKEKNLVIVVCEIK